MNRTLTEKILNHVITNHNGVMEFSTSFLPDNWDIKTIKAVRFTEEPDVDDDECSTKWNDYVDKIRTSIGVGYYCVWVRDENFKMVGILAFFDSKGEEIKVKHFENYGLLFKEILKSIS